MQLLSPGDPHPHPMLRKKQGRGEGLAKAELEVSCPGALNVEFTDIHLQHTRTQDTWTAAHLDT